MNEFVHKLYKLTLCLNFTGQPVKKAFLIMKLTGILICAFTLQLTAATFGQTVSLSVNGAPLRQVFNEVRKQTGYYFIYNNELIQRANPVTLTIKSDNVQEVLKEVFKNQPLTYYIDEQNTIVVHARSETKAVQRIITGTVLSKEDGGPMPGVVVREKGTLNTTATNEQGKYSIRVNSDASVLVFSYLGFTDTERNVGSASVVNLSMEVENKQLEEVVVQAYGTIKRGALTSAVSTIGAKDLEKRPVTNITTALAGSAPGIMTNSGGGQPGTGMAIRIRGFGTINGDASPLFILDGAPYDGVISNINPNDIESISVLKDAAASSLYGTRAAHGVIIITTKNGVKNQDRLEVRATQGVTSRGISSYEKVGAEDYYALLWESYRNNLVDQGVPSADANGLASGTYPRNAAGLQIYPGTTTTYSDISQLLVYNPFNLPGNQLVNTSGQFNPNAQLLYPDDLSWRDAMERTGIRSDYSIGTSGGSEKTTYYTSLNYLDDRGYTRQSDFNRITGRVKIDASPKKWLKAGMNASGTLSKSTLANEDNGINENPFYVDLLTAPIYPVYKHDPVTGAYLLDDKGDRIFDDGETPARPIFTSRHILAETMLNQLYNKRNALQGRAYTSVNILPELKVTFNASVDVNNYEYLFNRNKTIGDSKGIGRTSRTNSKSVYTTLNQLLNYNKDFGKHNIDVLLGHESYQNDYQYQNGNRDNQIVDGPVELDNYSNPPKVNSYVDAYRTESYFSRLQYAYDDKYFATAAYRHDGSSKFHPTSRWGAFWSVSAGWQINKGSFFKADWVDLLKARVSYGEIGSDNLGSGYYLWQSFYAIGNNNNTEPGMTRSRVAGNIDLEWETIASSDVALEFSLFKNRLNGTLEYFNKASRNLLFNVPLAESTGLTTEGQNIGGLYNRGFELQLSGDVLRQKDFRWNLGVNLTTLKNRITKMPDGQPNIIDGTKNREVGRSIYDYWLRAWYGVNPDNGQELYLANPDATDPDAFVNAAGVNVTPNANSALYHYAGTAIPDLYGSVTNALNYKNFTLSFTLMFQLGGKAFDSDYQSLMYNGSYGRALHVDALNRWQSEGQQTDVPRRTTGNTMFDSDRFLIDASSVSMRTATLNYALKKSFAQRIGLNNASVFLTGENLFIVSRRKGLDPTQAFTGVSSYTYAPTRVATLGLNVTF
jgi:TonB-linked SusC/RagA family outer membrane protein